MQMADNDEVRIEEIANGSVVQDAVAMQNAEKNVDVEVLSTTEAIEIGHSSDVLKIAYDLVSEAYALINNDNIAKKYLDLDATVTWKRHIWNKITEAYDAKFNKDGKEVYHLRAFDALKLQYPMCITTSGRCSTSS